MGDLRHKFVSASIWTVAGRGSSNLVSFIVFALLARFIGPADFGIVALASVFVDLTRSLALAGIPSALVKESEWHDGVASTAFWANTGFSLVLVLVMAIGVAPLAAAFYDPAFQWVLSALSLSFVIDGLRATHEARLQRDFGFKILARRTFFATVLGGIIGVAMAFLGFGVWALVANRLATSAIQTIVVWLSVPWRPRFVFLKPKFFTMFRFGMHLGAAQILGMLNARVPELVIGGFVGVTELGFYRLGSRSVSMVSDVIISPIQVAALSAFSRLHEKGSLAGAYLRLTRACAVMAFPVFYGAAVIAPDFVVLCFGEKWQRSGMIMAVLAPFGGAASLGYFFQPVMAAAGKTQMISLYTLSTLLTNLIVALAAAPFGVVAVALGFTLRAHAGVPFGLLLLQRAIGIPPLEVLKRLAPAFSAATVMALILIAVRLFALAEFSPLSRLCLLVALGAALYAGQLCLLHRRYLRSVWSDLAPSFAALPSRRK